MRLEGGSVGDIAAKLGSPGIPSLSPIAVLPSLPVLSVLEDALRRRAVVRFDYHDRPREVAGYGLVFKQGSWYFVGSDRSVEGGAALRTFRADRIKGTVTLGEDGTYEVPDDFSASGEIRNSPFSLAASVETIEVVARIWPNALPSLLRAVGPRAIERRESDGSVVMRFLVADERAIANYLLGLGEDVEVLEPPRAPPHRDRRPAVRGAPASRLMADSHEGGERLIRLLAMLAYLSQVGEAAITDLSARFDIDERTLVRQLELAACCGLPPYTPDALLELVIDDGRVYAFGLDALRQPPRLTPQEGFALAASARAMLEVSAAGDATPLASALEKLETALGASRLGIELDVPEHVMALRLAAEHAEVLEIDYLGAARGKATTRRIEPFRVTALEGTFYVDAYCRLAGDWRRFQVERISDIRPTGERAPVRTAPEEFSTSRAFVGGPHLRVAEIEISTEQVALVERVAKEIVLSAEGRALVRLEVADAEWFGRLLLRLGRDAVVKSPSDLQQAAAVVATRALQRYGVAPD